jgi:SAM-dependent methyltransferase/uncharacterized protein YbaR (Trm112 family)
MVTTLDPWFAHNLVCPADLTPLRWDGKRLHADCGHSYSVVDGIPVLLRADVEQTHRDAAISLTRANEESTKAARTETAAGDHSENGSSTISSTVHTYVQHVLAATNGFMYRGVTPTEYPIPSIRLPQASGEQWLLDVGCNWGRWCIAGARKGYRVVGIDPSLEAVTVARDVARQLGTEALFVAADGRYLPFRDNTFDVVFSFSVLQHFSKAHVRESLSSVRRVLRHDGVSLIQMLNRVGVRSLHKQAQTLLARKQLAEFDIRYWTTNELRNTFSSLLGPSRVSVDAFFSANSQTSDLAVLPAKYKLVVRCSEKLRAWTNAVPALTRLADSLYVTSSNDPERLQEVERHVLHVD